MNNSVLENIMQLAYSMKTTIFDTIKCTKYCESENIKGAFVECGLANGSQLALMALNSNDRLIYGLDSFEGVPLAGSKDTSQPGIGKITHDTSGNLLVSSGQAVCSLQQVEYNFVKWGIDLSNVTFIKGWFQHTLPDNDIGDIAMLRLDGDLYDSTRVCLEYLYPKLVSGGVLIIDDWGLPGCKLACDEYLDYSDFKTDYMVEGATVKVFIKK